MDLNSLLRRNQRSLIAGDRGMTPRDRQAHAQFARDYADQTRSVRAALAGPSDLSGPAR